MMKSNIRIDGYPLINLFLFFFFWIKHFPTRQYEALSGEEKYNTGGTSLFNENYPYENQFVVRVDVINGVDFRL